MEVSEDTEAVQTGLNDHQLAANIPDDPKPQSSDQAAEEAPPDPTSDQLAAQIVKQVNFYFSDANLPTDAFLLKEVQKNPEGWVPVRLIASFKRMKALSKDQSVIVAALQTSSELELSGHRVRRMAPLSMLDDTEVLLRTVIAENLPDQPTIDTVTAQFSAAGKVNMVRICQPNGGPRSVAQTVRGADLAVSRQLHALVEYSSQAEAAAAVKQLTDSNNWRSGLKVRPLLRTAFQPKQKQHQQQQQQQQQQQSRQQQQQQQQQRQQQQNLRQTSQTQPQQDAQVAEPPTQTPPREQQVAGQNASQTPNGDTSASEAAGTVAQLQLQSPAQQDTDSGSEQKQQHQRATEASANSNTQEGQSMPSSKGKKARKSKRDYAAWAGATAETRALATAHHNGNPDLEDVVPSSARPRIPKQNIPAAPGSQPAGPDGSKGFAMGRGRAIPV